MPDFDPPFADDAPNRRVPTADERENGLPCGPADRALFNGLFNLIEGNIGHVLTQAGEAPVGDFDHTALYRAIAALIAAATGETSGDVSNFVLMTQARARMLFFPETITNDGKIVVTSTAPGNVRLPGGVDILHRGIYLFTTVQTDFATNASKTYHLRWSVAGGFELKDLANVGYNPTALAETSSTFDSTYDDMLIARIVTNAGNVPTITNLANKHVLFQTGEGSQGALSFDSVGNPALLPSLMVNYNTHAINWARTPRVALRAINSFDTDTGTAANDMINSGIWPVSRYAVKTWFQYQAGSANAGVLGWQISA